MNLASKVTDRVFSMMEAVSNHMATLGGEPYDSQQISRDQQRKIYESLTPEEMFQLIGKHGKTAVEQYIKSFEGGGHA